MLENTFDVITIGSATLDIFVKSPSFKVLPSSESETGVVLCEAYGAKIEVDEMQILSGGGATNAAVSFQRKGLRTAVIAEMGKDIAAEAVLRDLHDGSVDTRYMVQEPSERTAMSVVLVAPEGGRSIVTYRGASKMLEVRDIDWSSMETRWMYISSLGGHIELLEKIVLFGQEKGIKIAVNPGGGELAKGEKLRNLIGQLEVLVLNAEEACALTGMTIDKQEEAFEEVRKMGARYIVITKGQQGSYVYEEGKRWQSEALGKKAVETTGAGDAYGSGFVAGLALGWDVLKAIQLAGVNAASVVMHVGAKKGLVSIEEFEKWEMPKVDLG